MAGRVGTAKRVGTPLLLIGAGAVVVALLVGVGDTQVRIAEVGGEPGSARLGLGVASCNADPRVEVEETATQVRLGAFIRRPGLLAAQDDCRDSVAVTLRSPLDGRVVVDTASGEVLVPTTE